LNAFSSIYWVFIEPTSCNACSRNICSTQVYITIVQRLQLKIINSKFFSIFDEKIVLIFFVLFLSISFLTYPFVNKSVWYPWCFSVGCQALDIDAWMPGCQSLAVSFICILSSCQYDSWLSGCLDCECTGAPDFRQLYQDIRTAWELFSQNCSCNICILHILWGWNFNIYWF